MIHVPVSRPAGVLARIVSVLAGLAGLALVVGGVWLAGLGGSWYYLLAGIALLVDAWLLWTGRAGGHRSAASPDIDRATNRPDMSAHPVPAG